MVMDGVVYVLVYVNFTFNVVPTTKSLEVNYAQVTTLLLAVAPLLQVP